LLCLTGTPPLLEWPMEEVLGSLTISETRQSAWDGSSPNPAWAVRSFLIGAVAQ
jgi:hypothetical protein